MPEKHSIIIVDDEKSITELLKEILVTSGFEVETTNDSEEALQIIQKRSFDVILTDLKMPKISGIELIERALLVRKNVIPIIMTGYGTIESAVEAMKKGAVGYIPKPFRAKNIISVIQKELEARDLRKENTYLKKIIAVNDFFDSLSCESKIDNAYKGILETCEFILPVNKLFFFIKSSPKENCIVKVKGDSYNSETGADFEEIAKKVIFQNIAYSYIDSEEGKIFALTMRSRNTINGVILMLLPADYVIPDEDLRILRLLANRVAISIENMWLIKGIASSIRKIPVHQPPIIEYTKGSFVSEIASIISHEISNPLSALQIAIDYINNLEAPFEKGKFDQAFSCINEGVMKISDIVNNLRSLSVNRIPVYSPIDVNSLVTETLKILDDNLALKKINTEISLDERNPVVQADKDQIQQVFMNIIANSIEAIKSENGLLKIVSIYDDKEKCVYVSFEDNGSGIQKENLERIFDPFFTADEESRKKAGLGLAIAKKVIGKHQGNIKAESEPGKGTKITVKLNDNPENI